MTTAEPTVLPGGAYYGELIEQTRRLLDVVVRVEAPDEVLLDATERLGTLADELSAIGVDTGIGPAGLRIDLPGRGHPLLAPLEVEEVEANAWLGSVTFRRAHLGGRGAVHGGMVPLLFDEIMGRLVSHHRPKVRTAYLKIDYRQITPIGVPLTVQAEVMREEGRKIFAHGRLQQGDALLAEAEGLFVIQREGQP
jgi:acyl-coenzyme A thioesterase PaaI-like protein